MGQFHREFLPHPVDYFAGRNIALTGKGKWRTAPCPFHGGHDSLRVNTEGGGWVCMACGEKGGDVLTFEMKLHGVGFVEAARALRAYVEDGRPPQGVGRARRLSYRDMVQAIRGEAMVVRIIAADMSKRKEISAADLKRLALAACTLQMVLDESQP